MRLTLSSRRQLHGDGFARDLGLSQQTRVLEELGRGDGRLEGVVQPERRHHLDRKHDRLKQSSLV